LLSALREFRSPLGILPLSVPAIRRSVLARCTLPQAFDLAPQLQKRSPMTFLTSLEQSGLGHWMRQSPSMFAYTGMITIHAIGLAMAVGFSWVMALRVLGVASGLPIAPMKTLFPLVWAGFWLCAFSGTLLLVSNASRDIPSPIFLAKLAFVGLGAYMTAKLRNVLFGPSAVSDAQVSLSPAARRQASIVLLVWFLAVCAGRLNEYPQLFGLKYH
jgi:hypothetical protein